MVKLLSILLITSALASPSLAANGNIRRKLLMDPYWPERDVCDNSVDPNSPPELGPCDESRFPNCEQGKEELCYNRKPSRDEFFDDNHQPKFYIQYDRVFCYPTNWGACSSCTPGRYCRSEDRCILEEQGYPCAEWL